MWVPKWSRFGQPDDFNWWNCRGSPAVACVEALLVPGGMIAISHQSTPRVAAGACIHGTRTMQKQHELRARSLFSHWVEYYSEVLLACFHPPVRQHWITLQMTCWLTELWLHHRFDRCHRGWVAKKILSEQGMLQWRVKVKHQRWWLQ